MKKIFLMCVGAFVLALPACTTLDKASKDAATVDDSLNAGDARIIHHMARYEG